MYMIPKLDPTYATTTVIHSPQMLSPNTRVSVKQITSKSLMYMIPKLDLTYATTVV